MRTRKTRRKEQSADAAADALCREMEEKYKDNPIRKRRKEMGLTIRGLAELAGIPTGTFADAERGRCGISAKNSEKLAAVFQCDAEELVKETESYAKQKRREKMQAASLPGQAGKRSAGRAMQSADAQRGTETAGRRERMTSGLDMRLVHERNPMKSLKGLREKAKLSTWEAAKRAGIPAYQWEGLEKGEEKPDIRTARRIAAMFQTEWCWIFREVASGQ